MSRIEKTISGRLVGHTLSRLFDQAIIGLGISLDFSARNDFFLSDELHLQRIIVCFSLIFSGVFQAREDLKYLYFVKSKNIKFWELARGCSLAIGYVFSILIISNLSLSQYYESKIDLLSIEILISGLFFGIITSSIQYFFLTNICKIKWLTLWLFLSIYSWATSFFIIATSLKYLFLTDFLTMKVVFVMYVTSLIVFILSTDSAAFLWIISKRLSEK